MPQQVPLHLAFLWCSVGSLHNTGVYQVSPLSPGTRLHVTILSLHVDQAVLEHRVPSPHDVVEEYAGLDNELDISSVMVHGAQKNLESVGKDSKCVFNYPSGPWQSVVEDSLFPVKVPGTIGLHQEGPQAEGVIPHQEVWHILSVVRHRLWLWPSHNVVAL